MENGSSLDTSSKQIEHLPPFKPSRTPLSLANWNNRAMLLWRARGYDKAIRENLIALELEPALAAIGELQARGPGLRSLPNDVRLNIDGA
jgi:hypothetical protein